MHRGTLLILLVVVLAWPATSAVAASSGCDFNGDTFDDLAVGAPGEDVGTVATTGAVNIIFGSASGLTATNNQIWTLDTPGVVGVAAGHEAFGSSTACGDFDGNGFSDLAIGSPGEDVGSVLNAGAVHVLYGSVSGLTAAADQSWTQNSSGVPGSAEAGDRLGQALAVGDFNGDAFADLAVGVAEEAIGSLDGAGGVNIWYGSPTGLTATGSQFFSQDTPGVEGTAEADDGFGWSLAVGDFNGDTFDELSIGTFTEDLGGANDAGMVNLLYGSAAGLSAGGDQTWSQNSAGIGGTAESGDLFGYALTAGDFDGDTFDDLAIGVPSEDLGTISNAGLVTVIFGSSGGLRAAGHQIWHQDTAGIKGTAESGDRFGLALLAVPFGTDGRVDLVVGVSFENLGSAIDAGAINVIYGSAGGLDDLGDQAWNQDSTGIAGSAETGDVFGRSMRAGDFDNDGDCDLAIGIPGEAIGSTTGAGAVSTLQSTGSALTASGNVFWTQPSADGAENGDEFGAFAYP